MKLVFDLAISGNNARNSEGSFIRLKDGSILFAYSRYCSASWRDEASCSIAGIRSLDEGETWSEPEILVKSSDFGVANIMSVSALQQQNGDVGLYFLIKENDGHTSFGRALSADGVHFTPERCEMQAPLSYYVVNNDRFLRLQDGRIAVPVAMHAFYGYGKADGFSSATVLVSDDDGKTFCITPCRLTIPALNQSGRGMQEPGIYQYSDGTVYLWARTTAGFQYECFSRDLFQTFTTPQPSPFSSPASPLEIAEHEGVLYAVYNPAPSYNGHTRTSASANRTPLVVRKSLDEGRKWSLPTVIEGDKRRGYCYPALFFTRDGAMLCAYCRGGLPEEEFCLQRMGITKIPLEEICPTAETDKPTQCWFVDDKNV
ncbi:MAG: exo-alpha-sialidase [Clostridia bacterium]|nr:exo-alpha-sialidase [Clostridia bacterium]